MQIYKALLKDLEIITKYAYQLTLEKSHRVWDLQEKYGIYIYTKMCLSSIGILRICPKNELYVPIRKKLIWDISSTATLTRTIVDAYMIFFYLIVDEVENSEKEFRFILWKLHAECERLNMLQSIGSTDPRLSDLKAEIESLQGQLKVNQFFQSLLLPQQQEKYLKGRYHRHITHEQICERAGIPYNIYSSAQQYLSNHVHTYHFSLQQLNLNPNTPEGIGLFITVLSYAIGFLAFATRDFISLFLDEKLNVPKDILAIISDWEDKMNIEKLHNENNKTISKNK